MAGSGGAGVRDPADESLPSVTDAAEIAGEDGAARLRQLDEGLATIAHGISHDLRGALGIVDGFVQILLEDHAAGLDADGRHCAGVIRENCARMRRVIADLLRLSHTIRAGRSLVPVDMRALADAVVEDARRGEPQRRIDVRIGDLPAAVGDRTLLREALGQLVGNAFKFTRNRDAAEVEIGARPDDCGVTYFVRDNGAGFDAVYAHKLFGVFQRLHPQEEFEGNGMGLALVRLIAERHGGSVAAEVVDGGGARFSFTLPQRDVIDAR
jgi:light-regulated signal transduction histidine kinase (bacteriophytochrome)